MRVYDSLVELMGNTPLVRLHKVSAGLPVQVLAKVEYFNPGGSVKDRIALKMVEAAGVQAGRRVEQLQQRVRGGDRVVAVDRQQQRAEGDALGLAEPPDRPHVEQAETAAPS